MNRKMLFVYNPRAGKAQVKSKLAGILDVFAAAEYEIVIVPTRKHGDACAAVAGRSGDYELVVCCGGDGTLDEVVTGMIRSGFRTPIGYIPAGSTNDFGGSLSLPKNMVKAAELAVRGRNFPCDIGSFSHGEEEDVFVYIAAFGLFTDVSYETGQDMKNVLGHMAYLLEGVKKLTSIRPYHVKVRWGENEAEDDFIYGMITNSTSVGGFKNITGKDVRLDDGYFEVTLIRQPKNPLELNNIIMSLLNPDMKSDAVRCFRTAQLTLESEEPVAWTLDGENGGSHTKVEIRNINKGIDIRVKKETPKAENDGKI